MSTKYKIYTDGACSKNGSVDAKGGWGYIILKDNKIIHEDSGSVLGATNQQMELMAAINACTYAFNNLHEKEYGEDSAFCISEDSWTLYSDSAYMINCYTAQWWSNWQRNGWLNAKKEAVANKELWQQLIPFFLHSHFKFEKVIGHSTDIWNAYVDRLCVAARGKLND